MIYLHAADEFILPSDFEEVKTGLVWLAERFLPVGTKYGIWYDPDVDRAYGRGRKALMLWATEIIDHMTPFRDEEHQPPLWDEGMGCYRVLTRIASGEPPRLREDWRARKQLRYKFAQEARHNIEETSEDTNVRHSHCRES